MLVRACRGDYQSPAGGQLPVAVPDSFVGFQKPSSSVDRGHSLSSLLPPQAALPSLPDNHFTNYAVSICKQTEIISRDLLFQVVARMTDCGLRKNIGWVYGWNNRLPLGKSNWQFRTAKNHSFYTLLRQAVLHRSDLFLMRVWFPRFYIIIDSIL